MKSAFKATAWLVATFILVFSLSPLGLRPDLAMPHGAEHFLVFLALSLAVGIAHRSRILPRMLALVVFAAGIEIAQLAVPGRHARLSDFLMGFLGCVDGTALALIVARVRAYSGRPQLIGQRKTMPLAECP